MTNLPYPAPQVHLPRDGGDFLNLADLRPAAVVLFFYPRDNTSSCTIEAKTFTSFLSKFEALNTKVIGISKDTVNSHDKFVAKQKLKIPLMSDENNDVCQNFDVWKEKSMYGNTFFGIERSTFLIDAEGQVVREWRKVKVSGHVEAVLEAVKGLS
ncbi:MAG: peroxiredoxin [Aestuariivita sp.]|nr:peroxiredoxin [Aestuariivita sp.]